MAPTAGSPKGVAGDRSPLLHVGSLESLTSVLRSPTRLNTDAATFAAPPVQRDEDNDIIEEDDPFGGQSSLQDKMRKRSRMSPPNSSTNASRSKSAYRPPIRTSSPIAPTTTRASASRPLYKERNDSSGSIASSKASGTKRQLMPSIPSRKESANSIEDLGGRSKSSTNIQTLAQAIAARAQQVAAANALAKAGNTDDTSSDTTHTKSVEPALDASSSSSRIISTSTSAPEAVLHASVPVHSEIEETDQGHNIVLTQSFLAAKQAEQRMSKDSTYSQDSFRWSKAGWNLVPESGNAETGEAKARGDLDSTDTTTGKYKTSDSDHSVSTGPTSQGEHRQSTLITTGAVEESNGLRHDDPNSTASSGSHEELSDGKEVKAVSSSPTQDNDEHVASSSLDGYATAPGASSSVNNAHPSSSDTADLPFPTSPSSNESLDLSSSPTRSRRKSRPKALNLQPSPKTPASTSVARGGISPSKTPPPSMPPLEPLPPVPPGPSNAYQKISSIHRRLSNPRDPSLDSSSPLLADLAAMTSSKAGERRGSDSSSRNLQSEQSSLQQSRSTQPSASALVSASHATTLAEAENAQAVLNQVALEPTFNEKRASLKALARERSAKRSTKTDADAPRPPAPDLDEKQELQTNAPMSTSDDARIDQMQEGSIPARAPTSTDGMRELRNKLTSNASEKKGNGGTEEEGSTGEDEEEEAAIVTRVTSIAGKPGLLPNDKPRLIRADSALSARAVNASTSEEGVVRAVAPSHPAVRAQETAPSAWTARPIEKAVNGDTGSIQHGLLDLGTPLTETPSEAHYFGGAWSVQGRNSEVDTDRNGLSPANGRAKRLQGRSSGTFAEIASAFRQLQAEKKVLERVIRATTPFAGVGTGEDLAQYLTILSDKLALSTAEIRRLLDLLDQQRNIMDYMVETHQLECAAYQEEINDLNSDLDAIELEADTHRMNCIKTTEDLDRTSYSLAEEVGKRDHFTHLLRSAKDELARMEAERVQAVQARTDEENAHSITRSALENARGEHAAELQSQKETLEIALLSLKAHKSGSVTPVAREAELPPSNGEAAVIADLQKQLEESRKSQAESERQLQELKAATQARSTDEMSVGSLSPLIEDSSQVEEALRDKLVQQEQDIAELRAAVALGAGAGGTREEQLASLPAGQANQVQMLLADLAEKRAREAQIRSAYKQVRDELRKLQLSQQQDRRRSQANYSYLASPGAAAGSSASSHGHGGGPPPSSYFGAIGMDSSAPSTPDGITKDVVLGPTPRALKRLSLPVVSKQLQGSSTTNGGSSRTGVSPGALARLSVDGHGGISLARKYATSDRGADDTETQAQPDLPASSEGEQIERIISPSTP